MNDWDRLTMVQEHCDDMLRCALTEQMVRQAFRQKNGQRGFRCRLLCGLGRRLAALGARLQEAYGGAVATPNLRPAHPGPA
jgi:hypothetical protein